MSAQEQDVPQPETEPRHSEPIDTPAMAAHCLHCHRQKKTAINTIKDASETKDRRGRRCMQGTCSACGHKVCRYF